MSFTPDLADVTLVLKELSKEYIIVKKKDFRKRTKEGQISLLDEGHSYREIAKKYSVSHTAIAKIKKEGLSYCDKISTSKPPQEEKEYAEEEATNSEINMYRYAIRLKNLLEKKYKIKLSKNEASTLMKEILQTHTEDTSTYNYYEYQPEKSYVELTLHSLLKG